MKLILASKSPRRKELLEALGYSYEIRTKETDESFPLDLKTSDIANYIARLKANDLESSIKEDEVLLTADTIVVCENKVLGKPESTKEAFDMISQLSDKTHQVITGVCITTQTEQKEIAVTTEVTFKELTSDEINFYIENYQPFDKAGAYGIQEWIGLIAVSKIEGSYSNVVGLPTKEVNELLSNYSFD